MVSMEHCMYHRNCKYDGTEVGFIGFFLSFLVTKGMGGTKYVGFFNYRIE